MREGASGSPPAIMQSDSGRNESSGALGKQLSHEGPLDPRALEQLLATLGEGGERFLGDLIQAFVADSHELLVNLRNAIEQQNAEELRLAAHSLKSNAANFGARALEDSCRQLEAMGKEGRLAGSAALLEKVELHYQDTEVALTRVRAGLDGPE